MRPLPGQSVADYTARFLKWKGVTHVFGLPGGENIPMLEAFRQAGLRFILMHHEACVGFAADVTGQLTDRPGVGLSTVGPGAINLLAGATGATLERSPMLALTAEIDPELRGRVTHMKIDQSALFSLGVKGSFSLGPDNAAVDMVHAWRLACAPPRGGVHVAIAPGQAVRQAIDYSSVDKPGEEIPPLGRGALSAAQEHLAGAKHVFLLAGLGVEASQAAGALLGLAEAWQAPVAVTPKAKGQFPEDHPLYTGCFSAYADRELRRAMGESDLIVGVGLDGVDFVTSTWNIPTPVVNLNEALADDPVTRPVVAVEGNLVRAIEALLPLRHAGLDGARLASSIRTAVAGDLETGHQASHRSLRLLPLVHALQDALPAAGAVTLDVGAFKLVFLQAWQARGPKTVFVANGLSAMGYALPGALAVKLAQPGRPVVAILGDGALLMYAGELATAARLGLPVVILVVVDQALALIRLKQRRQQVPIVGTEFGAVDCAALARAFGLDYLLLEGEESLSAALSQALRSAGPILVEARVDKAEYEHFL